jgi:hypothetical protein
MCHGNEESGAAKVEWWATEREQNAEAKSCGRHTKGSQRDEGDHSRACLRQSGYCGAPSDKSGNDGREPCVPE